MVDNLYGKYTRPLKGSNVTVPDLNPADTVNYAFRVSDVFPETP